MHVSINKELITANNKVLWHSLQKPFSFGMPPQAEQHLPASYGLSNPTLTTQSESLDVPVTVGLLFR